MSLLLDNLVSRLDFFDDMGSCYRISYISVQAKIAFMVLSNLSSIGLSQSRFYMYGSNDNSKGKKNE